MWYDPPGGKLPEGLSEAAWGMFKIGVYQFFRNEADDLTPEQAELVAGVLEDRRGLTPTQRFMLSGLAYLCRDPEPDWEEP
jgi:hypothetical protein